MTVGSTSALSSLPYDQEPWATPGTTLTTDPPPIPASFIPLAQQLDELVALPEGWNSYLAQPVTARSCQKALDTLVRLGWDGPLPTVSPTPRGGVQLEWGGDEDGVEFEFGPDGSLAILVQVDGRTWEHSGDDVTESVIREASAWAKKLA